MEKLSREGKNIKLEDLEERGLYKGFSLRPDTSDGVIKMYQLGNKIYDVYLKDFDSKKVDKIIEWDV